MNQRAAMAQTLGLAIEKNMPEMPGSELGLEHMRDMYARVQEDFSESKLGRWLGWMQCALVAANVGVTLEDVKQINMGYAGESTNPIIRNFHDVMTWRSNSHRTEQEVATQWRENLLRPKYSTSWYYATREERDEAVEYLTKIIEDGS